jgi:glucosamine--fructose-6-phosphate aminotransferase (isomerizing)
MNPARLGRINERRFIPLADRRGLTKKTPMQTLKSWTEQEIHSQPEAWEQGLGEIRSRAGALRDLWRAGDYEQVIFTGCGSPYYLAIAVAATLREKFGLAAQGIPASEVWLNPQAAYAQNKRTLLVALSRSGETTELLEACKAFRARGQGDVVTLSCSPQSSLSELGNRNVLLASGQEVSLAQTRAFTTLYLAALACGAIWTGKNDLLDDLARLPIMGRRVLNEHEVITHELGSDQAIDHYYFLGSGPRYGLACELSLKMKEMSLSDGEPFHFLEFRHGPQTMVGPNALVVGLMSESNYEREMAVMNDMRVLGGRTLSLGERDCDVNFDSGIGDAARNLLYLPIGQLLALARALSKGLNPDQPHNLSAWVKLV